MPKGLVHESMKRPKPSFEIPKFELSPEKHTQINGDARAGKDLTHYEPRALAEYGKAGSSEAHFKALETARAMKESEYKEVSAKLPLKLRTGLKSVFNNFLEQNYPKPKRSTGYHQ